MQAGLRVERRDSQLRGYGRLGASEGSAPRMIDSGKHTTVLGLTAAEFPPLKGVVVNYGFGELEALITPD